MELVLHWQADCFGWVFLLTETKIEVGEEEEGALCKSVSAFGVLHFVCGMLPTTIAFYLLFIQEAMASVVIILTSFPVNGNTLLHAFHVLNVEALERTRRS